MKAKTVARHATEPTEPREQTAQSAQSAQSADADEAPASSAAGALGGELRRQRKLKGMSLDELASASSVSRAMISKIERGQSSPSTSILSKLVDALDTTVARLLGQETPPQDVVLMRADQQVVLVDAETGFSRRVLSPILPGRGLDFVMAEMPPKSDTGPLVAHTMPVEEYIYVLSGSLVVTVGATRAVLNASDAMYYRADVPHRFENEGRTACKYLIVISPVRG
ncbi:helix-turn-helix domain-containing protein [Paraburkholderia unamae]|uniref:XRE family transcriptional regulator n=1 Tax=Paraburkholderia unamae TaxID=219649 RepID=A0ABX5KB85_9BURK|nr:XRE family transcriptional regulator [Paraburkholderia unamae]PVX72801.1 XRE family transcriptional regulator [Paraburkholderia unamae]